MLIIEMVVIQALAKVPHIQGLKTRTNCKEVLVLSLGHAGRTEKESFHSFFTDQTHQDVVKDFDGLEMLKIRGAFTCLKVDANILDR